jgi:3-hydroxyacyl-[acyl-carrier-protein] dehydratase
MSNTFLLNDFYTIDSFEKKEDNVLSVQIKLKVNHDIFKGHFEQMPVVPGVCQTQIIKEVLQKELNTDLIMSKGDNIKFTGMIIPTQTPIFLLDLKYKKEETNYIVDASLFFENTIFTKFKGTFIQN